ncbi:MAG: hypothetical protein WB615_01990 [Candidatus Tumulicola sp.]
MNSASDTSNTAAAFGLLSGMMFFIVIVAIALTVFFVWCFWRVFAKTGMNGALGLLCLIPSVGPLICLLILAFTRWPIEDTHGVGGPPLFPPGPPPPPPPAPPPGSSVMPTP